VPETTFQGSRRANVESSLTAENKHEKKGKTGLSLMAPKEARLFLFVFFFFFSSFLVDRKSDQFQLNRFCACDCQVEWKVKHFDDRALSTCEQKTFWIYHSSFPSPSPSPSP
jgi:hypothetical protein